jgi:hypothetical protein
MVFHLLVLCATILRPLTFFRGKWFCNIIKITITFWFFKGTFIEKYCGEKMSGVIFELFENIKANCARSTNSI